MKRRLRLEASASIFTSRLYSFGETTGGSVLHVMVVVFGILSFALTFSIGILFHGSHREMGKAMFALLVGQSMGMAIMSVFAYSSLIRSDSIPGKCQVATWLVLFVITIFTSIHLVFRMIRIEDERKQ